MKIHAIVWLTIIAFCFGAAWIIYFVHYPLQNFSYVLMLRKRIEKISLEKFVYLGLCVFLLIFGLVLAVAPGIAAYSVLVVQSLLWIFFTVKKQIHRSKIHKVRSTIVQIIIILIAVTFILIEYTPKDGFGLVFTLVFLILLFANFGVNVGFLLYDEHLERKSSEVVDDLSEFKSVQQQYKAYGSVKMSDKSRNSEQTPQKRLSKNGAIQMTTPKRQPLMNISEVKQTAKSKLTELKTLRKQLKFGDLGIADERKVELLSSIRKMEDQQPSALDSSILKGL